MPLILPNYFTKPTWATAQQGGPLLSGNTAQSAGAQPNNYSINMPTQQPLFGRPGWTYLQVQNVPTMGPTPRLAQGTGLTGRAANRQLDGFVPGGFLTVNDYRPHGLDYQPKGNDNWLKRIPRTIGVGSNGRELVGTYEPHDFTPAEFGPRQWRSAPNWQSMEYPPGWRNLVGWQQAAKYNLLMRQQVAAPLPQANYFLGYTIQPQVASTLPVSGGYGAF